jgi:hypothetical protein
MMLVVQIALGVVFGVLSLADLTQIVAGTRKVRVSGRRSASFCWPP